MVKKKPALGLVEFRGMDALIPPSKQEAQETQEAHETHEVQEAQDAQVVSRVSTQTQGRKGQKLPRINMAFTKENQDYLHRISRIEGCSITDYVNHLVKADFEKRKDLLRQLDELKIRSNSGSV